MKTLIGISRDHSLSMAGLTKAAMDDYNKNITSIKQAAQLNGVETRLSVVKCGVGPSALVEWECQNLDISDVMGISSYVASGQGTPLFDSVGTLINALSREKDQNDTSFLVMVITDGGENFSRIWNGTLLSKKIDELQETGKWTFVFRVPRGYKHHLTRLGVPDGNIIEWDLTESSLRETTIQTEVATSAYFGGVAKGFTATRSFYTDMSKVTDTQVKTNMRDISKEVTFMRVSDKDAGKQIRTFCVERIGSYTAGKAFYQLTKREKAVQDYKMIMIRDRSTNQVYAGLAARNLLGIPDSGTISLSPGDHGKYDIFVQSTSVNRKLVVDTEVVWWENAR